jgi:hypothetical protein
MNETDLEQIRAILADAIAPMQAVLSMVAPVRTRTTACVADPITLWSPGPSEGS